MRYVAHLIRLLSTQTMSTRSPEKSNMLQVRFAAKWLILFPCVVVVLGCRTSTVGIGVALVGDSITEIDARRRQSTLLERPLDEAYSYLGEELDVLIEERSGERFVCFPTTSIPGKQSFYLLHVSHDGRIHDLQHWIDWHDGFEDTVKVKWMERKIVGRNVAEAEAEAKLPPPLFVFRRQKQFDQFRVYNATNWTHIRPRLLGVTVDADGMCRDLSYYGIAGAQGLQRRIQSVPSENAVAHGTAQSR